MTNMMVVFSFRYLNRNERDTLTIYAVVKSFHPPDVPVENRLSVDLSIIVYALSSKFVGDI